MKLKTACLAYALFLSSGTSAFAQLAWTSSGPGGGGAFNVPSVSATGRVAGATTGTVMIASDLGGVYRSTNLGTSWTAIGSNKGLQNTHVEAIIHHPSIDGTVFVGGEDGVYRSTDCGTTQPAGCNFPAAQHFNLGFVTSLGIADAGTATATTVYAAGLESYCTDGPKIWRSTNNGTGWTAMAANGLPNNAYILGLRVRPGNPNTVIALSAAGRFSGPDNCPGGNPPRYPVDAPNRAYLSTDGGANFTALWVSSTVPQLLQSDSVTPGSWAYIEDAKWDLADPQKDKIWITVTPNPALGDKSVDGELWMSSGATGVGADFQWQSSEHTGQIWPLTNGRIRTIDLRRQRPWDTGENGVFEWTPSGATGTWAAKSTQAQFEAWTMGWAGVVTSTAAGAKKPTSPGESLNGALHTITPVNDTSLWWVDSQFAFKTTNSGTTFQQQFTNAVASPAGYNSRKIDNAVPGVLVQNPVTTTTMHAGYFDMGCWLTTNSTAAAASISWKDCNGPKVPWIPGQQLGSVNPDLSGNWLGYGGNTTGIAPDPVTANTFWAVHAPHKDDTGDAVKGIYKVARTNNGGTTWTDQTFNLNTLANNVAVTDLMADNSTGTTRIWAVANNRLFRLNNGATSWTAVSTNIGVNGCDGGLLTVARKGTRILAGGAAGVCYSSDSGTTWNYWSASGGITGFWLSASTPTWWNERPTAVTDFAFAPGTGNSVAYMTVMAPDTSVSEPAAGLYKTVNGGANWTQVTTLATGSFERNFMRTVAVHPTDGNRIVVGSSSALLAGGYFLIPGSNPPAAPKTGAWVSTNGGVSWSADPQNNGLAWPFITRLRFTSGTTPRLYGISPGQGIVFSNSP